MLYASAKGGAHPLIALMPRQPRAAGYRPIGASARTTCNRRDLMTKATTRGLILTVAMLAVCVAAAIPAQAAITPARTRISFTSTNFVWTLDAPFSGGTRCPTAELTVTTHDAGTSASGRVN